MRPGLLRGGLLLLVVALVGCAPGADTASEPMEEAAPAYVPPDFTAESRDLDQADVERMMEELSNWGRWGSDDQLGAANLITPQKRLEALALATEGITVSLAHRVIKEEAEDVPRPFGHSMLGVPDASAAESLFGGVSDNYNVSYHGYSHSHIDSLCHILYRGGQMYNGVSQDTITEDGCSNASIVNLQGGIVTRGVLLDFPRLKGVPYLEPGTPIYVEDIEAWEEMAGVTGTAGRRDLRPHRPLGAARRDGALEHLRQRGGAACLDHAVGEVARRLVHRQRRGARRGAVAGRGRQPAGAPDHHRGDGRRPVRQPGPGGAGGDRRVVEPLGVHADGGAAGGGETAPGRRSTRWRSFERPATDLVGGLVVGHAFLHELVKPWLETGQVFLYKLVSRSACS